MTERSYENHEEVESFDPNEQSDTDDEVEDRAPNDVKRLEFWLGR